MCVCVGGCLCVCVGFIHMNAVPRTGRRRLSDSLELELQVVMAASNQIVHALSLTCLISHGISFNLLVYVECIGVKKTSYKGRQMDSISKGLLKDPSASLLRIEHGGTG